MVAALYVRRDSVYKKMNVDCYDIDRDARTWPGGNSLIAHPPCRAWGQLSHMSNPREGEKNLAIDSINLIRKYGGVLEHPRSSKLWHEMNLPKPGQIDIYGGFTILIHQSWFGHKAEKKTFLYICGMRKDQLPPIPISFDCIEYTIASKIKKKSGRRIKKEVTKQEREHTPVKLAEFLYQIVKICDRKNNP